MRRSEIDPKLVSNGALKRRRISRSVTLSIRKGPPVPPGRTSIVKIEVDKVPVPGEPGEADAGQSQQNIGQFGPNPAASFAPALEGVKEHDQRAQRSEEAHEVGEVKKGIATAAEVVNVVHARNKNHPAQQASQIDQADG